MLSTISILLAASLASATPFARQATGDNGSCKQLFTTCKNAVAPTLQNVFSIESCLFAASCFSGQRPVDEFLTELYSAETNKTTGYPASNTLPRVTRAVFNTISTDKKGITQQNFIDGYYSQLSLSKGPWPTSSEPIIGYYQNIAQWTGFCTYSVPFKNFGDYFQYSATVSSPGCYGSGSTIETPVPTSTPKPPPPVSSDPSCQKIFDVCNDEVLNSLIDVFFVRSCVLAATCFSGQHPVAGLIAAEYKAKNNGSTAYPAPANLVRLSPPVFNAISTDGKTWTQQNFIDAWYSQLSTVGGPFPPNADAAIGYFNRILDWTGFCPGQGIPYANLGDYYQYSSTVDSPKKQC